MKVRTEVQTRIDDPQAMAEILRAAGLAETATVQKRRASYLLDGGQVELDELPMIGMFVEVEAASEAAVDAICRKLGLTGQRITEPYMELLAAHCRREGIEGDIFTF